VHICDVTKHSNQCEEAMRSEERSRELETLGGRRRREEREELKNAHRFLLSLPVSSEPLNQASPRLAILCTRPAN